MQVEVQQACRLRRACGYAEPCLAHHACAGMKHLSADLTDSNNHRNGVDYCSSCMCTLCACNLTKLYVCIRSLARCWCAGVALQWRHRQGGLRLLRRHLPHEAPVHFWLSGRRGHGVLQRRSGCQRPKHAPVGGPDRGPAAGRARELAARPGHGREA